MQLTKFTDYSLRCLMYLAAQKGNLVSVKIISEYYNISYEHLTKVVHKLSVLGYIESKKGKNGGITLALNPEQLLLGDLVKKLEPNMNFAECFDPKTNTCKIIVSCQLKHYLYEAQQAFLKTLNKYTLANLSKSGLIKN